MIRINSYLHREVFHDLTRRWMHDQVRPEDALLITRLVHFNNVYVTRYLNAFCDDLFQHLHARGWKSRQAVLKRDLKDAIVTHPPYVNARIEDLILQYWRHPERYYRETPFQGTMFFLPDQAGETYIGSSRIKRVRRLAEKSARRIIDNIFEAIKKRADDLADNRARKLGIDRDSLVTRPEDMEEEFHKAEEKLLEDLRARHPIHFNREMIINDVAGIKVILEDEEYPGFLNKLENRENCEVLEEEPHRGTYNAINLIVEYTPDKKSLLGHPLSEKMLALIEKRGLDPETASRSFTEFVHTGEDRVTIEVIVCNYQEMLESEIGRCMHEDRIMQQRLAQEYHGHLAKNIECLMVYMFNFAHSPQSEIGELPIKLWNRYLPDTFDEMIRSMFELPPLRLAE